MSVIDDSVHCNEEKVEAENILSRLSTLKEVGAATSLSIMSHFYNFI